jgi:hypothetical protein
MHTNLRDKRELIKKNGHNSGELPESKILPESQDSAAGTSPQLWILSSSKSLCSFSLSITDRPS